MLTLDYACNRSETIGGKWVPVITWLYISHFVCRVWKLECWLCQDDSSRKSDNINSPSFSQASKNTRLFHLHTTWKSRELSALVLKLLSRQSNFSLWLLTASFTRWRPRKHPGLLAIYNSNFVVSLQRQEVHFGSNAALGQIWKRLSLQRRAERE